MRDVAVNFLLLSIFSLLTQWCVLSFEQLPAHGIFIFTRRHNACKDVPQSLTKIILCSGMLRVQRATQVQASCHLKQLLIHWSCQVCCLNTQEWKRTILGNLDDVAAAEAAMIHSGAMSL